MSGRWHWRARVLGVLLLSLVIAPCANAGKYGADFLDIGVGARYLGLGGACTSMVDDASAGYWNPAGLAATRHFSGLAMHTPRFGGLQSYQNLALARSTHIGSVGFTWIRLGVDDIPIYAALEGTHEQRLADRSLQPTDVPDGFMSDIEDAFLLSYAGMVSEPWRVGRRKILLSFGASLKYIRQRFAEYRSYGIGFDLGTQAEIQGLGRSTTVGLTIHDAYTTTLHWNTDSEQEDIIKGNFRLGIAYRPTGSLWQHMIFLIDLHTRYGPVIHLGVESDHLRWVLLRAGMNGRHPTFGAGLRLSGIQADYAFITYDLDTVHQVSLSITY